MGAKKDKPAAKPPKEQFGPDYVFESRGEGVTLSPCLNCGALVRAEDKALHTQAHA